MHPPHRHSSGFTLVELMITVAVIAILIGIGFPSFSASLRSNRVATHANEMIATVSLARTEAIKSNIAAGICPSANGTTCGGTWNGGWLVFVDTNNNGAPNAAAVPSEVVRVIAGNPSLSVIPGAGLVSPIMFSSRGLPTSGLPAAGTAAMVLQPLDCPTGAPVIRSFFMNATGQIRMQKGNCP